MKRMPRIPEYTDTDSEHERFRNGADEGGGTPMTSDHYWNLEMEALELHCNSAS
jgi:hypothetical protein